MWKGWQSRSDTGLQTQKFAPHQSKLPPYYWTTGLPNWCLDLRRYKNPFPGGGVVGVPPQSPSRTRVGRESSRRQKETETTETWRLRDVVAFLLIVLTILEVLWFHEWNRFQSQNYNIFQMSTISQSAPWTDSKLESIPRFKLRVELTWPPSKFQNLENLQPVL